MYVSLLLGPLLEHPLRIFGIPFHNTQACLFYLLCLFPPGLPAVLLMAIQGLTNKRLTARIPTGYAALTSGQELEEVAQVLPSCY